MGGKLEAAFHGLTTEEFNRIMSVDPREQRELSEFRRRHILGIESTVDLEE